MEFKVVKTDNRYEDILIEKNILAKFGAELSVFNLRTTDEIIEATKDVDGIIADLSVINSQVISNLKKCKVISKVGIGVDNIDVESATKKGIFVCNVPDYCFQEVSDHTLALILTCARRVTFLNATVKKGFWEIDRAKPAPPLDKMILGLIGFGSIARLVAKKAKAFGFKIWVYDPFLVSQKEIIEKKYRIVLNDFEEVLRASDIVSIHCPLNSKTENLFNCHQFDIMKQSAYLINTSRGKIVSSSALYNAIKGKKISGAAVDVFDPEPIDPGNPILQFDNFIITPHFGFYSERSILEVRKKSALNVGRVLTGRSPINIVNKELIVI